MPNIYMLNHLLPYFFGFPIFFSSLISKTLLFQLHANLFRFSHSLSYFFWLHKFLKLLYPNSMPNIYMLNHLLPYFFGFPIFFSSLISKTLLFQLHANLFWFSHSLSYFFSLLPSKKSIILIHCHSLFLESFPFLSRLLH